MSTVKESAIDVVQRLPDECSWDDVMYRIYVRQKIEAGIADADAGRKTPHDEVFKEFEE